PPTPPPPPEDSLPTLRRRAPRDSTDAHPWLLVGRAHLGLGAEAPGATPRASADSGWTRAGLDPGERALARPAGLAGPPGPPPRRPRTRSPRCAAGPAGTRPTRSCGC